MQIEIGKYYRTRDGRKVGPAKYYGKGTRATEWIVLWNGEDHYHYSEDGKSCLNVYEDDLVSEWEEDGGPNLSATTIDSIAQDSLKWHYENGDDMEPIQKEAFRIIMRYYGMSF